MLRNSVFQRSDNAYVNIVKLGLGFSKAQGLFKVYALRLKCCLARPQTGTGLVPPPGGPPSRSYAVKFWVTQGGHFPTARRRLRRYRDCAHLGFAAFSG